MGSRIMTMKRQGAELGRIRTGYSTPNPDPKKRAIAQRSATFILSSHSREYVERAAVLYGGAAEEWTPQGSKIAQFRVITEARELRAILPPGDPLSQYNELWSGGGCSRRCDGITEQLSRRPCMCLAEHGENWHEQPAGTVCKPTSRLNVMLADLPDFGVWRLETHSYYAADAMAGGIDAVLAATDGKSPMPLRMWIEQREVKRRGKTKRFPVIMVVPAIPSLRHALSGPLSMAAALDPGTIERPAIEAARGVPVDYRQLARECRTPADVINVWHRARAEGHAGDTELRDDLQAIAADIERGVDPSTGEIGDQGDDDLDQPGPDADGVYDVEVLGEGDEPARDEPPAAQPAGTWPAAAQPGSGARR
ncbi:recombination directionality factor [Streptomyces sp. NBC_00582]|uniref:recombination directionality factor n=1 Tax=Streptomyces sp. NBC_00582 TaxID=2975783 RepID=UPI002E81A98A|nr:hypothetical protein [Streptomyces sp. NBC_00582]WUB64650.1 hypothetical protein OG852_31730 [Streptomyces sp. NBC_00582]